MAIKMKPVSKYITFCASSEIIDAIRRSGVKIDPMFNGGNGAIKVAEWVPDMVQFWRSSRDEDGNLFADMGLEEFLRRMASQYS